MHRMTTSCIVITQLFRSRFPQMHCCANIQCGASQTPLIEANADKLCSFLNTCSCRECSFVNSR
jgi:hypothetical protein